MQASHSLTSSSFLFFSCSNTGLQEGKSTLLCGLDQLPGVHNGASNSSACGWGYPQWCVWRFKLSASPATSQFLQRSAAGGISHLSVLVMNHSKVLKTLGFEGNRFPAQSSPNIHSALLFFTRNIFSLYENNCTSVHKIKRELCYTHSVYFFIPSHCTENRNSSLSGFAFALVPQTLIGLEKF